MKKQTLVIILLAVLVVNCFALTACHECEFGEWTVVKQATCTEAGQLERSCSCGEKETSTLPVIAHSYTPIVTSPNCTEVGFTTHTCSNCGDSYVDTNVQPVGHSYKAVITEPTCLQQGYTTHTCANCGDSYVDTYVDALGHSYEAAVTTPTCTEQGYTTHTCHCGDSYVDAYIEITGHNYSNGVCMICNGIDEITKNAEIDAENARHEERLKEIEDAYLWLVQTNESRIAELKEQHNISYVYDNLTCYEKVSALQDDIDNLSQRIALLESYNDPSDLSTIASLKNQKEAKESEMAKYEAMIAIHRYEDAILSHTDSYNSDIEKENTLNEINLSMIEKKYDCYEKKHNVVILEGLDPTCEGVGITEGLKCESCNVVLVEQVEIPATGHTSDDETGMCKTCGANLFEAGLVFVLNETGTGYIVSDYTGTNTVINIPDKYKDLPIVAIGDYAFYKCINLENISLPESITSIGQSAFYWCEKLKSIVIGPNVQFIGTWAFHHCTSLETIYFNATELADLSANNYVFTYAGINNKNLLVTIGPNVKRVPNYLFNPGEAVYIKTVVFEDNSNCVLIGQYSFYGCSSITSITLGDSITSIGMFAFSGCTGLNMLSIPNSVTDIEYGAFIGCTNLTNVIFEEESQCVSIGDNVFYNCTSLKSITIPDSVTSIGGYAFSSCTSLTNVYYTGTQEQWNKIKIGSGNSRLTNATITYNYKG